MLERLGVSRLAGCLTALLAVAIFVQPFLLPLHVLVSHGADPHNHHHKGSAGEASWQTFNCLDENDASSAARHCATCASYAANGRAQAICTNTAAFFPAAIAVGYMDFAERAASPSLFAAQGRSPPVA